MTSDWTSRPHVRARDIDREYAMGLLRHASGEGQLSSEELDERLRAALHARTLGELAALVGDLQDRAEHKGEVPVVPAVPYPYVYAPSRPAGHRAGWIAAVGAGLVGLLAVIIAATGSSPDPDPLDVAPAPAADPCLGVIGYDVDLEACGVPEDNPLRAEGLSGEVAANQKALDLPGNLPVPARAAFVQPGWVSATYNEDGRQEITRRWHLEYLVSGGTDQITAEHLAEIYRATVAPVTFGSLGAESPRADGGLELRWTGGPYPLTVTVVREPRAATWRVRLDVLVDTQTSIPRPDVSGEFRDKLQVQPIATVPGMAYESSKVTWSATTTCRLEQVWSATNAQLAEIREQATALDAKIDRKPEGGARVTFQSTLSDCTAFQL